MCHQRVSGGVCADLRSCESFLCLHTMQRFSRMRQTGQSSCYCAPRPCLPPSLCLSLLPHRHTVSYATRSQLWPHSLFFHYFFSLADPPPSFFFFLSSHTVALSSWLSISTALFSRLPSLVGAALLQSVSLLYPGPPPAPPSPSLSPPASFFFFFLLHPQCSSVWIAGMLL